jgi:hypothetical protein
MIEATQKKLAEGKFFFGHRQAESRKTVQKEPEDFGYFLSAFLSAGRSVTFALQFEQKDDYDAWYVGWESGLGADDRKLWKEMNAHRVEEVHRDGAKTAVEIEMVPMIEMARENPLPAHLTHFGWFGENKVGLPVRYFEFEAPR